jgi:hypothetical protein
MGVASYKPLLFDRFRTRAMNMGLLLEPTAERVDLFTAWKTSAPRTPSERSGVTGL